MGDEGNHGGYRAAGEVCRWSPVALFTSVKRSVVDNRAKSDRTRVFLLGVAGRDCRNFNAMFRANPE